MSTQNILYHDGCNICLDTADTFSKSMKLEIVDLSIATDRAEEARGAGVTLLPSIVIDGKVFTISPHSEI
jgi:glutaredoxin